MDKPVNANAEYRALPAVDALLREPFFLQLVAQYGQAQVTGAIRLVLADARVAIRRGQPAPAEWSNSVESLLAQWVQPSLRPVINATGVIIHTNLGRAPLSLAARRAMEAVARGYSNLEYDLDAGERGSRHDHIRTLLCELTGAEDALIVNNNAGAVYLTLAGLCQARDVLIGRGQLVEIGGGFRIPDVLRQSGANLVEVGTTNRTHARDFTAALSPSTAAIMRVHSSNFRQIGFVTEPALSELAAIARGYQTGDGRPIVLIDDLGSGSLLPTHEFGLAAEPMVQESLATGADVVTFSGDKLLGGPQAGLILGRAEHIDRLRRHPMARALRVDKLTLAALDATLRSYQRGRATEEVPVWQMIAVSANRLAERVRDWQMALGAAGQARPAVYAEVWSGESAVGGGSLPGESLPTYLLAIHVEQADVAAARLRSCSTPVICRIQKGHLVFDARTVLPEQDEDLLAAVRQIMSPI